MYRSHRAFHNMMVKSFLKGTDEEQKRVIRRSLMNLEAFLDEKS